MDYTDSKIMNFLKTLPAGDIDPKHTETVIDMMRARWHELKGGHYKVTERDLPGYCEDLRLILPYTIEFKLEWQHPAASRSSWAQIHLWQVDLIKKTATCNEHYKKRRIGGCDKRLNVKPIAEKIAEAIISGDTSCEHLDWKSKTKVKVEIKKLITANNNQTEGARRKRFRKALEPILAAHGWMPGKAYNWYVHQLTAVK